MQLFGIDQYSVHLKRTVTGVILLLNLLMLEGIGALIWLLLEPSESSSNFFLGYSLERWILIFSAILFTLFVVSILWGIKSRSKKKEPLLEKFERYQSDIKLPGLGLLLVIPVVALMIWLPKNEAIQPYYIRLLPLLFLATATIIQLWLFVCVIMWKTITQTLAENFPISEDNRVYPLANKSFLYGLIVFSIGYLILQINAYFDVRQAIPLGDTTSFFEGASLKLSDPAFFSERRPWGILLIYKILNNSFSAIEIAQLAVSTFSWLLFAWVFSRSLKNYWIKLIGFVAILGFSLSPTVQVWNHAAMSESFTISFTVLIFAVWVTLMQTWKWGLFILLNFLFLYWMSIHEVNLYIGLMVSVVFLGIGAFRKQYRVFWIASLFILIVFTVNFQLSSRYGLPRWALPIAEVITMRVLPNQEYLDFFANHGMPVIPELMTFSGKWANTENYAIVNSIELRNFSKWLFNDGNKVYARFLLTHPLYAIKAPLEDIRNLLAVDFFEFNPIPHYTPALPKWVNEIFFPIHLFSQYLWSSAFVVGLVFVKKMRSNTRTYWSALIFFFLSIPYLYLTWHGDAHSIERHAVIANIQFHLGIWLLFILYLDKLFTMKQPPSLQSLS
jgi:hypothetical protein